MKLSDLLAVAALLTSVIASPVKIDGTDVTIPLQARSGHASASDAYPGSNKAKTNGLFYRKQQINPVTAADVTSIITAINKKKTTDLYKIADDISEGKLKGSELWILQGWHSNSANPTDPEHATLRLWNNVNKQGKEKKGNTWHLYRNGDVSR
ncbi:hypothetical protein TWF694_009376 [Orbilia ellipsospora]|uniref:Uncharacterized protein n=1 Tax=Orbilia ellipsospora TaxID=2528407 RepID=A0AAV9XES2_9PEZI